MAQLTLPQIDALRETFGEPAKDMKLNLGALGASDFLDDEQLWGVALASAFFINETRLTDALTADAKAGGAPEALFDDARAAAVLMGMNTIYYRFRHLVGKESYSQKAARLRMTYMSRPKTSKATFELMSLAIAALAGCELCIKNHEASILQHGLTEDHVHDAVRVAAILQGAAVAVRS
ncbi:MAG: carboxymuconolactone decarboxylase family protein [Planctomycetes bacterium]|nr:carboxymuconolactone decarboxylase family protein [Planctomycetota bacterium]